MKKHCTVKKSKTVEINRSCCDCCNQYQLASGLPRDFTTSLRVLSGQFSTTGAGSLGSGGSNSGKCGQDVETGNSQKGIQREGTDMDNATEKITTLKHLRAASIPAECTNN
jgi:hypothetical protein